MSDQIAETTETAPQSEQSELDILKAEAKKLGITHHPKIKAPALQIKINEFKLRMQELANQPTQAEPSVAANNEVPAAGIVRQRGPARPQRVARTPAQIKKAHDMELRKAASRLVRIQITCMNPNKREWEGEIFSCGNSTVGQFKKFVPFNKPWHVPTIIVNMIKERQCQIFKTVADARGNKVRKGELIPEYSVVELDPLTEDELKDLAKQQAVAGSID